MAKDKGVNLQLIIWFFALIVLAGVIYFAYYLYDATEQEIAEQFNTQQLILAQEAATGIEEYLGSLRRNMQVLKEIKKDSSLYGQVAHTLYQKFQDTALADIWLVDAKGKLLSSITHPQLVAHSLAQEAYFINLQRAGNEEIYTSGVFKLGGRSSSIKGNKWIVLSLKLADSEDKASEGADLLMFLVSVDKIISKFVLPIRSGKTGYAWVLDDNGTLLHHPEHPEMIDRSIFGANKSCQGCHQQLFELEKQIVRKAEQGKNRYVSATTEDTLIAYAPSYMGGRVWSIMVAAPYTEVTFLLRESFYQLISFLAAIGFSTLGVTIFVLRINKQRLVAENKARYAHQLEKEVAEQTHEIKQEKQKLDDIVSAIGAQLSVINKEMQIVWANNKVQEEFGLGKFTGKQACYQVYYQRQKPCSNCPARKTFQDGGIRQTEQLSERGQDKAYYQITTTPIYGASGEVEQVLELTQDITIQKRQEQNLIDSKKMLAVGQIAVGLAHDLGNPLSIIAGSVQFCLQNLKPPTNIKEHLKVIARNVTASNKVVKALLQFARPSLDSVMTAVNLTEIIQRTLLLLSAELAKKQIKVREVYDKKLPAVQGDKGQLEQVFVNIVLNSIEALPKGGEITVRVQYRRDKQQVCLGFADNGPGIAPEHLESTFDPFFTTRVRGVGLGLSISKKIIETHKGSIRAENQATGGAKITICLPVSSKKESKL